MTIYHYKLYSLLSFLNLYTSHICYNMAEKMQVFWRKVDFPAMVSSLINLIMNINYTLYHLEDDKSDICHFCLYDQ